MMKEGQQKFESQPILIVIPVFNDWEALALLLSHLDKLLHEKQVLAEVLLVNDASSIAPETANFSPANFNGIKRLRIVELRRNLGHQRAIALGLAYVEANVACCAVIVMDADGEDDPQDVLRLIEKCRAEGYRKMIFARRAKRSEGWLFKIFYICYRGLYKLLTGREIRVGNFSIIPYPVLRQLVAVSELWNHYAVGALKARVPYTDIAARRSNRLAGHSQMNFVSLVTHGLSAISVYGDIVGVRLLIATSLLIVFAVAVIATAIIIRFTTQLAIPGWTTYVVALFLIILMQGVVLSLFFIFIILSGRDNFNFLPLRDYHHFISRVQQIFPAA